MRGGSWERRSGHVSLKLKPYPEYKDSGVPWLGKIPAHWECSPLRRVAQIRLSNVDKNSIQGEVPVSLCNYTDVYYRDYITGDINFMQATATPGEIRDFTLEVGDVLITKDSESWADIAVPAQVAEAVTGVLCGYHLAHIRPRLEKLDGEYLFRAFQAEPIAYQFRISANGVTRFALSKHAIASSIFPVPSLQEQQRIAAFLRRISIRTRTLIRAKRRQIELLTEQRRTVIHQAVTRGMNPSVQLKPSGLKWIPWIPKHWSVSRVKREFICLDRRRIPLSSVDRGQMTSRQYDYYGASGVIDKVDGYLFDDALLLIAEDGANLVSRNLPLAITASGKFWVNNHAHILKPTHGCLAYLAHLMEVVEYQPWISGAAQPKLTQDRLMSIKIPVPPIDEQLSIATKLEVQTSHISSSIHRIRQEISLVREYHARLIADVITGQLDVQQSALPHLDETVWGSEVGAPESGDSTETEEELEDGEN